MGAILLHRVKDSPEVISSIRRPTTLQQTRHNAIVYGIFLGDVEANTCSLLCEVPSIIRRHTGISALFCELEEGRSSLDSFLDFRHHGFVDTVVTSFDRRVLITEGRNHAILADETVEARRKDEIARPIARVDQVHRREDLAHSCGRFPSVGHTHTDAMLLIRCLVLGTLLRFLLRSVSDLETSIKQVLNHISSANVIVSLANMLGSGIGESGGSKDFELF
jgi:hypothetical protein